MRHLLELLLQQRRSNVVRHALMFLETFLIQLIKRKVVARNSGSSRRRLRLPLLLLVLKLWAMDWPLLCMRMPLR